MFEDNEFENAHEADSPQSNEASSANDLVAAAQAACDSGDDVLGMHLYLAAYERASQGSYPPSAEALEILRTAWDLAVSLKERTMAEYVFEKIEPFLTGREMGEYADELQDLAFSRLEELGLSRDDLEEMAGSLSEEFFDAPVDVRVEQFTIPGSHGRDADAEDEDDAIVDPLDDDEAQNAFDEALDAAFEEALAAADADDPETEDDDVAEDAAAGKLASAPSPKAAKPAGKANAARKPGASSEASAKEAPREKYADLAGYDHAIDLMRSFGIGMKGDARFESFVSELNERHGLDRMPAIGTLVFHARAREDADRFMEATQNEIGLPVVRMTLEESMQGQAVLVVTSEGIDFRGRKNFMRAAFSEPMVLVMEDIDLWSAPNFDDIDERENPSLKANLARGVREAVNAVHSAVDSSSVFVLASASNVEDIDPFYMDMIEPATVIDIEPPTDDERRALWKRLMADHPSLAQVNLDDLVRLSAGLPRYDIEQAAREAIEEAYRYGLVSRHYTPVHGQNIFEKLAAYQPFESAQYRELEEKVLEDFRLDLDHLGDLLDGDI